MEILTPGWIPTYREDSKASSSITWVYSNYTIDATRKYTSVQNRALGDDACEEACSSDATCVGYAPKQDTCFVYTQGDQADSSVQMPLSKTLQPRAFFAQYVVNRKTPPSGWQVTLYLAGATLRMPADAEKYDNAYIFNSSLGIINLEFSATSTDIPTIEAQFVLSKLNVIKQRQLSDTSGEQLAAGIGMLVAIALAAIFFAIRWKIAQIGEKNKKSLPV